jgi:hypothetical protein
MRLVRRNADELRLASVVFAASDAEVARIDISVGPCIDRIGPRGGRRKPLVSRWEQSNDPPARMEILLQLVSGDAEAEPWADRQSVGEGSLFRFSELYAARLAALGSRHPPDASRDGVFRDLATAWLHATPWPKEQAATSVEQRLEEYSHKALVSEIDRVGLHYWFGPELPIYRLVAGVGDESWQAWRKEKRR